MTRSPLIVRGNTKDPCDPIELEERKPFNADFDPSKRLNGFERTVDRVDNGEESCSSSLSAIDEYTLYTPLEEETVVRTLDKRLVLFVAFLYMLSFLDRSNIGNAKVAGMDRDLHLDSSQFEWVLRAFYITYISFEWMTILWKIFPPHIYLAICVASWGLIASSQSLAFSFPSMIVLRACLGIGEAAFVGIPFYLSFFYRRDELAFRTGLFIAAAPLATSVSGSIAWAIARVGRHIPISPWRTLFLLEGFPSIIASVFVWSNIPDRPETATFLTQRQQNVASLRLRSGCGASQSRSQEPQFDRTLWDGIRQTLLDPKAYLTAMMFFCCNVAFASLPVFLPTIVEEIGYSTIASQALTAPPYLLAFCTVITTAWLSDHLQARSIFIVFHALLASFGYAMMALTGAWRAGPLIRYLGVYPAAMGFFSAITIIITWTLNNQEGELSRGVSLSLLNYIGQLGPLIGVHLYPESDGPYFTSGMTWCAVFMGAVAVLALLTRLVLAKENRVRKASWLKREENGSCDASPTNGFLFIV